MRRLSTPPDLIRPLVGALPTPVEPQKNPSRKERSQDSTTRTRGRGCQLYDGRCYPFNIRCNTISILYVSVSLPERFTGAYGARAIQMGGRGEVTVESPANDGRSSAASTASWTKIPLPCCRWHLQPARTSRNFKQSLSGVPRSHNEKQPQDVKLEVGTYRKVEVMAAPSLINPVSPVMGNSIDAPVLERLPLASPNVLFLLSLSSGASGDLTDVRTNGRGGPSITVNGGRTSNNSISLEGINVSDLNLAQFDLVPLPNPDVLQEFKVATSLYDSSQGGKGSGALGLSESGSNDIFRLFYTPKRCLMPMMVPHANG